jgi:hypothetical protein
VDKRISLNNSLKHSASFRTEGISAASAYAVPKPRATRRSWELVSCGAVRCKASFEMKIPARHKELG